MKHWKSLTKIDLTVKLPFSSTFLEVHVLLETKQSRPLFVESIISEFSKQPAEVITDGDNENEGEESDEQIAHPLRNEVDQTIKTLNRLSLFTEDSGFDPLNTSDFQQFWVFSPFLSFFFLNFADIAKDPIIRKII